MDLHGKQKRNNITKTKHALHNKFVLHEADFNKLFSVKTITSCKTKSLFSKYMNTQTNKIIVYLRSNAWFYRLIIHVGILLRKDRSTTMQLFICITRVLEWHFSRTLRLPFTDPFQPNIQTIIVSNDDWPQKLI